MKGLDPIALLDAILGRPDNLGARGAELLAYLASTSPAPQSKREAQRLPRRDLAERLSPLTALQPRRCFGREPTGWSGRIDRLSD